MDVSFLPAVSAGFPSPAEGFLEQPLDLKKLLTPHPDFTYFVRVEGESMRGAGLHPGDILVVDRTLDVVNNAIVVVQFNGGFLVKRIQLEGQTIVLLSEHPRYPMITVTSQDDLVHWGVVTFCLHPVKAQRPHGPIVASHNPQQRKTLR